MGTWVLLHNISLPSPNIAIPFVLFLLLLVMIGDFSHLHLQQKER